MRKNFFLLAIGVVAVLLLNACVANQESVKTNADIEDTISFVAVEPVKGKLDAYSSMARFVKYNVDAVSKNIHKKIISDTKEKTGKEVLSGIGVLDSSEENPLYGVSRRLDFAIVYAISHLAEDKNYVNDNIYAKSAQNLALVAIKTHKNALFAGRKIRELDRQLASLQKQVNSLNEKLSRNGVLSDDDLVLKKSAETAVFKLQQLRGLLEANVAEYASLVKVDAKKMQVEGRRFYELEDFDEKNQIETFQNVALDNRSEFDVMRKEILDFNVNDIKSDTVKLYPATATLEVNGYDIKDPLYVNNLEKRASEIAVDLTEAVGSYLSAKKDEYKKELKLKAFDLLGVAILVQIELDYNIVRMVDNDYSGVSAEVRRMRQDVRETERRRNLNVSQKIDLWNKKQALYEKELLESQIEAERALALRSLYFHAGLSPFIYKQVQKSVYDVEDGLKVAFNKDMVEMLARAEVKQKEQKKQGNTWAKDNNWLEVLIDEGGTKEDLPIVLPEKPRGNFDAYIGDRYNKMKVMQLGSYRYRKNADIEWNMLQQLYPELIEKKPKVESAVLNGKTIYRLILKSENGGFLELCNKLRSDRIECILR